MSTNPATGIKVTLLGDSLMTFPYTMFRLGNQIRDKVQHLRTHLNQSIIFYDEGNPSDTIFKISLRIESALSHHAEGLILFWDTDISDYEEFGLSVEEVSYMREKYEYYLRYVIEKVSAIRNIIVWILVCDSICICVCCVVLCYVMLYYIIL
jgi:hypothetical protein